MDFGENDLGFVLLVAQVLVLELQGLVYLLVHLEVGLAALLLVFELKCFLQQGLLGMFQLPGELRQVLLAKAGLGL